MRWIFCLSLLAGSLAGAQGLQDGKYVQACHRLAEDDDVSANLQIDGVHWKIHHVAYKDSACKTAFFYYDEDITVTQNGDKLDLKTNSATMTAADQATAHGLNAVDQCGYSQWKPNVPVDVTGKSCGDFRIPAVGGTTYSLIKMLSSTQLEIGIGDDQHDGSSEAQRFTTIEDAPFVLVP